MAVTAINHIDRYKRIINSLSITERPSNLEKQLSKARKYIRERDWIVKESDKNLGLVLMDKATYNRLLDEEFNSNSFKTVDQFPHEDLVRRIKRICDMCKIRSNLIINQANSKKQPNTFYVVPKIHKPTLKPRPITAQHSYIFSHLSKQLSTILNRETIKVLAITINSTQMIRQLETMTLPENVVLFTYDVDRMYPSMNIMDTISTLRQGLPHIFRANNGFWFHMLALILHYNYITAKNTIKVQTIGIPTGSAAATAIANLYLWLKYREVFKRNSKFVIMNRRYVDDGLVFIRSESAAHKIAEELNNASNLNITWNISTTEAISVSYTHLTLPTILLV